MGAFDYLPGFLARPIIKAVKTLNGTNKNREKILSLKREIKACNLERDKIIFNYESEKSRLEEIIENQNERIEKLNQEILSEKERYKNTINSLKEDLRTQKDLFSEYLAVILTGDTSRIDRKHNRIDMLDNKEERVDKISDFFNLNKGLISIINQKYQELSAMDEKIKKLAEENFNLRFECKIYQSNLEKYPSFAYVRGKVYGTKGFYKLVEDYKELEDFLGSNHNLVFDSSKKEKQFEIKDYKVVIPKNQSDDFIVGYIVKGDSEKRKRVFRYFGEKSVKKLRNILNDSFLNDYVTST